MSHHPARAHNASTSARKRSPRCSKSSNWSKLAQAGESRTTSPWLGVRRRPGRPRWRDRRPRHTGRPRPRAERRDLAGRLADQVGAGDPVRVRGPGERVERCALAAPSEDDPQAGRIRRERALGGLRVRRLRIVDEPHAADLADRLEPVRDAREGAQRLRDRPVGDSERAGGCGCGRSVLAVVAARDERFRRQRVVTRELDPACPSPARARTRAEPRPCRRQPGSRRSAASPAGRPRASRGGRGGRASGSEARRRVGAGSATSSSWKLESSQTTRSSGPSRPSSAQRGRPTLPATATGRPAARTIAPDQLGRRRLAVRPGDADGRLARPDARRARSRSRPGSRGRVRRRRGGPRSVRPGISRGAPRPSESARSASAPSRTSTPAARSLPASTSAPPVDSDDPDASTGERERGSLARAREAEDEGTRRQRAHAGYPTKRD